MTAVAIPLSAPIPSLARWGLSSDADLVFRTLATFGGRPARLLASELGLSRQRVDSALAELHECGAAATTGGDSRAPKWSNRPPDQVVHRLRSRRLRSTDPRAAARRHHAVFESINSRLAGLGLPLNPALAGRIADGVRYLPSRALGRRRLAAAMIRERHDHLVINTEDALTADLVRAVPYDEKMFGNGVLNRVLGRPPLDGDAAVAPEERLNVLGYRYRETLDTPLKMFICDRRVAFVLADPADVERGYLEIGQPEVVRALVEIFESRWASAVDPRAAGVPQISLNARERELIALLAVGHTDVTAAEELRISARSVTNTLRALMDRLGVENRFQLGLALGALDVAVPPSLTTD